VSLTLWSHPFASYCQKVLIALYESATTFETVLVDLADPRSRADFAALWPVALMPVLRDGDRTIPESSIIIEYLARHHPGEREMVPEDPDLARETRLQDRFFDLYVSTPMQKIVGDRLRPAGARDPFGVNAAKASLATAYGMIEARMATRTWAMGDAFTMADCAAAPALWYADLVAPLGHEHPHTRAYLDRLRVRPSCARVLEEAEPYRDNFPKET
jgi:glutathione S-transferase